MAKPKKVLEVKPPKKVIKPEVEKVKEVKPRQAEVKLTQEQMFDNAITSINKLIMRNARAITIGLFKQEDGTHYYKFLDNSDKAKEIRKEVVELLTNLWGSGSYNYQSIADALRIDTLDLQGLLDDQFRQRENLV